MKTIDRILKEAWESAQLTNINSLSNSYLDAKVSKTLTTSKFIALK